jgi:hypothetical protein
MSLLAKMAESVFPEPVLEKLAKQEFVLIFYDTNNCIKLGSYGNS